jgi:recombination protein RecA
MAKATVSTKLDSSDYKDKNEALKAALAKIKKDHGEEAVNLFADTPMRQVASTSTGSMGLDIALGIGGYPNGRLIEVYGPYSSGKSTLMLHAVAECQRAGGTAAYIDAEHALDPLYAQNLGVDMHRLVFSQPDYGEQGLQIAETLITSGGVDLVVVDSVAALVPQKEIEGEIGDVTIGLQARMLSQACRKFATLCNKHGVTMFFVNQIRNKIGVMFGNPETTPGGEALKFYTSVRLEIRKIGALKEGEDAFGIKSRVKVVKNKVAPPFKEIEVDILFGKGINYIGEVLDFSEQLGLVEKSGAWYSCEGTRIGQGRDKSIDYLAEHPELVTSLAEQIAKKYNLNRKS